MFDRINRRLAILAKEIEASKPQRISFEDFETKVFPYPVIGAATGQDTSAIPQSAASAAPPSVAEKPKFKVGDRFRVVVVDSQYGGQVATFQRIEPRPGGGLYVVCSCEHKLHGGVVENVRFPEDWLELIPQPASPEVDGEWWVKWEGGECPVPLALTVMYRMREEHGDPAKRSGCRAGFLRWDHTTDARSVGDIVAYKVLAA